MSNLNENSKKIGVVTKNLIENLEVVNAKIDRLDNLDSKEKVFTGLLYVQYGKICIAQKSLYRVTETKLTIHKIKNLKLTVDSLNITVVNLGTDLDKLKPKEKIEHEIFDSLYQVYANLIVIAKILTNILSSADMPINGNGNGKKAKKK